MVETKTLRDYWNDLLESIPEPPTPEVIKSIHSLFMSGAAAVLLVEQSMAQQDLPLEEGAKLIQELHKEIAKGFLDDDDPA